jgi:hypothetical protein
MVGAGGQRFQNDPPLYGKGHPLFAAKAFHHLHFSRDKPLSWHDWYLIPFGINCQIFFIFSAPDCRYYS